MPIQAALPDGTVLEFEEGTPDDVIDRVVQQHLKGGAAPAPAAAAPASAPAVDTPEGAPPPEGEYYDVPSAPDSKALESAVAQYYASLPKGTAPEEAKLSELSTRYGLPPVSNFPEILQFYEKYGTLNPSVAMQGPGAVPPPPPTIEEIVGTVEPEGDWTQRARAFGKGVLFDFADELEAAGRMLVSGELNSDEYYRIKNQINADYNQWAKANPEEALGLELAGGAVGTFIPGVGIVGKGIQLGRGAGALTRGAVAGASTGALSGLGQAETMALSDIAPSVLEQAALGTAFGGVLGKGTELLGRGAVSGRDAVMRRLGRETGDASERRASEMIFSATENGVSPQRAIGSARASQAFDVPTPFGMATPELAALSERVLAKGKPSSRDLAQTLVEAQAGAGERVAQQAREALPTSRDFFDAQGAITQRLRQIGEQDYQRAYAVGNVQDPQIESIIRNPELAGIWKDAESLARLEGRQLDFKLEPVFDAAGALVGVQPSKTAIPDVAALDYFKRALDTQIDAGFRGSASGGKARAAALRDSIRKPLLARLDELVPEYKEARSKYAGDLEVRDALDFGRDMLSKKFRPQEVQKRLDGMSVAEREAVKTGALQAVLEPLEDATRRGNVAQQLIGAGDAGTSKMAKLKAVMDPSEYDFFETALRLERDLYNRTSKATGGSRTVPLAEGVAQLDNLIGSGRMEDAVNFIMAGPQGKAASLVRWVSRFSPNREFGDKVYGQLSKALRAQNPQELADVLDMLARSESYAKFIGGVGDIAAQRVAPAVGGTAPSLFEDRGINPPPALAIGDEAAAVDDAAAAAQAAIDAPIAGEDAAAEEAPVDGSAQEVSTIMIDGREAIYDPTAGVHIFTDTNEIVDTAPMKRGGAVQGYKRGGRVKETSWFDDMVMAASRRGSDLVAAAADLADRYNVTPANAAAWIAENVEGRPKAEVERIRRNLAPLGSNRAVVEAGAASNERRFREAGGRGARREEDVLPPVRLSAATYKPENVARAVMTETPRAAAAVRDYFAQSTPSSVARDAMQAARSGYESFTRDPYGSVFESAVYGAFPLAAASGDYASIREGSRMLEPYAKEDALAARDQRMIDALSLAPLLGGAGARRAAGRKRGGLAVKKGRK